ncbi:MAG: hypothetical protein KGJ13_08210 [Patescibacteria group bacterium]|nr:hypothetical protein [Patescibacteria group bacterium]
MANAIFGWLAGPHGNPFAVHHERRTPKQLSKLGTKDHYRMTFERKELPGAGAGQYAFETLGLPAYPTFGYSGAHVTNPLRETFPASYVFQAVGLVGNPPASIVQGQFITQPLMDPTTAINAGVVLPGAIVGGPNSITNASPVLAP